MNRTSVNYKVWALLVIAIGAYVAVSSGLNRAPEPPREEIDREPPRRAENSPKKATKEPGRVVHLETNKGVIEFVLFEKDCPKTTSRIVDLVSEGCYDGVRFDKVEENSIIQTEECNDSVSSIPSEFVPGLGNVKGAIIVGLGIGIIEALVGQYITTFLKDAVIYGIMIAVLLIKPAGLFAKS